MTRGCLLLAISSSCSWQWRISWRPRGCWSNPRGASRLVRSSSARVARRCFFVSSGTSIRASILAQGTAPLRVHPSDTRTSSGDGTKVLRGLCLVIHLGDMAPGPHLGEEFLAKKEPVHQEMQGAVQPVQEINLSLTVMPVISHELADDRVVLLFDMGIVILVIRTGPGEGDLPGMAEADEVAVHELSPIVRMEGDHLPRIPAETGLIWRSSCRVSSSTWRCPWAVKSSTNGAMPPARRTGPRNVLALQMVVGACWTAGP